jgi:aspartate/methionine/tyrosine aminotransferase
VGFYFRGVHRTAWRRQGAMSRVGHTSTWRRYGDLSPSDFPALTWKKAVIAAIARKPARLAYDDPCGSLCLWTALQGYLRRSRSVLCDVDQIVVVNGLQQGLDICARLLLDARDRFVMGGPRLPDGEANFRRHRRNPGTGPDRRGQSGDGAAGEDQSTPRLRDALAPLTLSADLIPHRDLE